MRPKWRRRSWASCTRCSRSSTTSDPAHLVRLRSVRTSAPPIRRYRTTVAPITLPAVTAPLRLPADHCALLTDDGGGYSVALAEALQRAGWTCVIAHLPGDKAPASGSHKTVALDW